MLLGLILESQAFAYSRLVHVVCILHSARVRNYPFPRMYNNIIYKLHGGVCSTYHLSDPGPSDGPLAVRETAETCPLSFRESGQVKGIGL